MTICADPYAFLRRKLKRMEPLVDLDALRARGDVEFLEVKDGAGLVRGLAIVMKHAAQLNLRLYYADEPAVASALMGLLNRWVAGRTILNVFSRAA